MALRVSSLTIPRRWAMCLVFAACLYCLQQYLAYQQSRPTSQNYRAGTPQPAPSLDQLIASRFELSEDFMAQMTVEQLKTQLNQFGVTPQQMFDQMNFTLERMKAELEKGV